MLGLETERDAHNENAVIFIHGVLSNGSRAWGEPSWPKLIAQDSNLSRYDVHVFSYRTSISSGTYSIADAADALYEELLEHELLAKKRLILVCHSMGGIVARRFLVSNQANLSERGISIGLFLVASPSLGSADANLISVLSYALKHTQAAALRFSQANTSLDELHRDFKTLLGAARPQIFGRELIEDRSISIKRWFGLKRQTVEPFSAAQYFNHPEHRPLKIPGSDHTSIAKPSTRDAPQHRALSRFMQFMLEVEPRYLDADQDVVLTETRSPLTLREDAKKDPLQSTFSTPGSKSEIIAIEDIASDPLLVEFADETSSIAVRNLAQASNDDQQFKATVKLRQGKLLERLLGSSLVACHPESVRLASFLEDKCTEDELKRTAPCIRFMRGANFDNRQAYRLFAHLNLTDIEARRMEANLAGWLGSGYFPDANWNSEYEREKLSSYFTEAYIHSLWVKQPTHTISTSITLSIFSSEAYKAYYGDDIHFYDFMDWISGVHEANWPSFVEWVFEQNTCRTMREATLAVLCRRPVPDLRGILRQLAVSDDDRLSASALEAIAYLPPHSSKVLEFKRSLLGSRDSSNGSGHFARLVSAGIEEDSGQISMLEAQLGRESGDRESSAAAWSLGRISAHSPAALDRLAYWAAEHEDALIRSTCIANLAKIQPTKAENLISRDWKHSRGLSRFCLAVGRAHLGEIIPLLNLFRDESESEFYLPRLLTFFQHLWDDVLPLLQDRSPALSAIQVAYDDT